MKLELYPGDTTVNAKTIGTFFTILEQWSIIGWQHMFFASLSEVYAVVENTKEPSRNVQ